MEIQEIKERIINTLKLGVECPLELINYVTEEEKMQAVKELEAENKIEIILEDHPMLKDKIKTIRLY